MTLTNGNGASPHAPPAIRWATRSALAAACEALRLLEAGDRTEATAVLRAVALLRSAVVPPPEAADTAAVPARLRWALDAAGVPVSGLLATLAARRRPYSRTAVYNYVQGKTAAPVDFLADAADTLGVRRAWLAFGDGAPVDSTEDGQ